MKGKHTKHISALLVCCININRSTNAMHALAHNIAMSEQKFDILLIQELWWNESIMTSFQGWQVILPTPTIKEHERPRVVAYYRLQEGIDITLRTDICADLDFMILDIKREGSRSPPTRLINIYNQQTPGESQDPEYTTDRLARIHLNPETPTVITGDWNLHHNLWNSTIEADSTPNRMQVVVNWLVGQGFTLCSERNIHTRSGSRTQQDMIINLTFANEKAHGQGIVQNHAVNPDLAVLSDHHALTFTLGDPRETVENLTEAKYNWKNANEVEFVKTLEQELHTNPGLFETTIQLVLNKDRTQATQDELDNAVKFINDSMERSAEKTIPIRQMCSRSKPWWNDGLSVAFMDMRSARDMAKSYYQYFNHPSEMMVTKAKYLHKRALHLVKSAKRDYYLKLTEEANTRNMWNFRKWTGRKCTYTSPVLSNGEGVEPAVTHTDKCNLLRTTLFPPKPQLANEPTLDLEPREDDMSYQEVTKREVRDALFSATPMNAPSITGMTGRAYRWAWSVIEEEIFHLIRLCAKMGYHPREWRTSIAVALQKPKRDYSLPRSYRLIQLLEVLGKVLERIQARRLAHIAAKHKLFPSSQFGGIPGRSAEDALLCTVHDIETAWNHKRKASILTFDITGFFDTIPHSHLLNTIRTLHIPLPIAKWVHSFLQDRRASICLDGKRDELRTIDTGVPQGSCVSPILAAYFTSPMIEEVHTKTNRRIAESAELSPLIKDKNITLSPITLYVEIGRAHV